MVILQHDRAIAQGFELAGVADGELVFGVAMGEVEFGGPANAGVQFADLVDLAFGTAAQAKLDDVSRSNLAAGLEGEGVHA